MKFIIFADVHANLPALEAAINYIKREGYDQIYHLGDAIAIGPYPRECIALLLSLKNIEFVMGNHDGWYANGLPEPQPAWMSDGELRHQIWTHEQIGDQYRTLVSEWPWQINKVIDGIEFSCLHYALAENRTSFKETLHKPNPDDLDRLFNPQADLLFYGHTHLASDLHGKARYLSPGSLGCQKKAVAVYLVVEILNGRINLQLEEIPYDDRPLLDTFESRQVPERSFIYKAFFGNRFAK